MKLFSLILILWIVIYLVDSAIQFFKPGTMTRAKLFEGTRINFYSVDDAIGFYNIYTLFDGLA